MGLFGFGKKKDKKETEPAVEPVDEDKVAAEAQTPQQRRKALKPYWRNLPASTWAVARNAVRGM